MKRLGFGFNLRRRIANWLLPEASQAVELVERLQAMVDGEIALARAQQPFVELLSVAKDQQAGLHALAQLVIHPPTQPQRLALLARLSKLNIRSQEVLAAAEASIQAAREGKGFSFDKGPGALKP